MIVVNQVFKALLNRLCKACGTRLASHSKVCPSCKLPDGDSRSGGSGLEPGKDPGQEYESWDSKKKTLPWKPDGE